MNELGSTPQTFAHYLYIGNQCLPHFYDRLGERITYYEDENSIDGIISYLSIYAYYGDLAGKLIMPHNLIAFIHISYLEKVARIDDIYVAPEYRNRGIATELLNIAMQTASRNGYERMSGVLGNKPGFKDFFTKRGYSTHIFNDRKIYVFCDQEPVPPDYFYYGPWEKIISESRPQPDTKQEW